MSQRCGLLMEWTISQRKRTKNTLSVFRFLGVLRACLRNGLHIQELIESSGPVLFSGATRFTPFAVIGFMTRRMWICLVSIFLQSILLIIGLIGTFLQWSLLENVIR